VRVVLFDWLAVGHHPIYARRFAEALVDDHTVCVAFPESGLEEATPAGASPHSLGDERPPWDRTRPLGPQRRAHGAAEIARMREAIRATRADVIVHLCADHMMRRLARGPDLGATQVVCLHHPRAHYPRAYATPLSRREHAKALVADAAVRVWQRRAFAGAVLTWEDVPVEEYNRRGGAPGYELPPPPLPEAPPEAAGERDGLVLYGAMRRAKGVDLLADALTLAPTDAHLVLAGSVSEPDYAPELDEQVAAMRHAGVRVDLRSHPHTGQEGLAALGAARCAVLPYARQPGHSRTLVEAAAMGTPVVAHDKGLLGHTVRRHQLGLAVDCFDPAALREALLTMLDDDGAADRFAPGLAAFAARSSAESFRSAVLSSLQGLSPA
jgi:glycosyltransferase involved in cell wall biosynthesis